MASGNNTNNNNRLQPRPILVTPEQYVENLRWLQQRLELFNQMNREGLETYLNVQSELNRRIAEGEQAKQQMQRLQQLTSAGAITVPVLPVNGVAFVQNSGSLSTVNQWPAAMPPSQFVNGTDGSVRNAQNVYIASPGSVNNQASSSSEQLPTSSRAQASGNSSYVTQQRSAPPLDGISSYAAAHNLREQQHNQPRQSSITSMTTNAALAHHRSAIPTQPSVSRPASYSYPQRRQPTGPQASSSQAQMAQVPMYDQRPFPYQAANAGSSYSSGSYQGVPNVGLSRQTTYTTTSSSLASALGEGANIHLRDTNALAQVPIRNPGRPEATSIGINQSHLRAEAPVSSVKTSATSARQDSHETAHLPEPTSARTVMKPMSDEEFIQAQAKLLNIINSQPKEIYTSSGSFQSQDNLAARQAQTSTSGTTSPQNVRGWKQVSTMTRQQPTSGGSTKDNGQPAQVIPPVSPLSHASSTINIQNGLPVDPTIHRASAEITYAASSASVGASQPTATYTFADRNPKFPASALPSDPSIQVADGTNTIHPFSNIRNYYSDNSSMSIPLSYEQTCRQIPNASNPHPSVGFTTPPPNEIRPPASVTPASANKKTLAKDILRALNKQPEKRKAMTSESSGSSADSESPPSKKRPIEPSVDPPVLIEDVFTTPAVLPIAKDTGHTARIEEVYDTAAEIVDLVDDSTPPPLESAVADVSEMYSRYTDPDVLIVPDSEPSRSVMESRASSEIGLDMDPALSPLEQSSLPLFLPSPDSPPDSPRLASREEGKMTVEPFSFARSRNVRRKYGHRKEAYVEVPLLTAAERQRYLKSPIATEETKFKDPSSSGLPQEESFRAGGSNANVQTANENRLRLAHAAATVAVAASRLRSRPCSWNDCFHVANSTNSLKIHVLQHVEPLQNQEKIFPCWWGDCIRRFNKREALTQHLQNHVKKSILCAYDGCDAQFVHPLELLDHVESSHPTSSELRSSTQPSVPSLRPLPPLGTMFAYQAVNIPVKMAQISEEQRAKLGPWVARHCFGPVNPTVPKLNARNQLQRRRPDYEPKLLGDWQDRYDFVEPWGSTYPQRCADLESSKATEEIESGLLLAPDVAGSAGPLQEQLLTSRVERIKLTGTYDYVIKAGHTEGVPEAEESGIKIEDSSAEHPQGLPVSSSAPSPVQGQGTNQDFLGVGDLQ